MPEVLLIEDAALLRAVIALALQHEGFVVHAAGDAEAGLALLAAHPAVTVALVEIEVGPTEAAGFRFAEMACALRPGFGILYLTGRTDLLVGRVRGPREEHLLKPCPMTRVAAALRRLAG